MKDSKELRNKLLLHIGGFTLVVAVLGAGLVFLKNEIEKKVLDTVQLRGENTKNSRGIETLASLQEDQARARAYESALYRVFPEKSSVVSFIRELEDLATTHAIEASISITSEANRTDAEPGKVGVSMTVNGSLENITAYLDDINKKKYFVSFQSFNFVRQEDSYKATITGNIFNR